MNQYTDKEFLLELFQDSAILMRLSDNKTIEFDQLGRQIIQALVIGKTTDEIADEIVHQYDVDHIQAKSDVLMFLKHLDNTGLLSSLDTNGINTFPVNETAIAETSYYI